MLTPFDFYKIAIKVRNLELKFFWSRSLFFGGFILALFVSYYHFSNPTDSSANFGVLHSMTPALGILFSLAWSLANRGGKYWYESWEQKISATEDLLIEEPFFHRWEPRDRGKCWYFRGQLYSVSKIAILLSDVVLLSWAVIFLAQKPRYPWVEWVTTYSLSVNLLDVLFLAFICVLLCCTRTTIPDGNRAGFQPWHFIPRTEAQRDQNPERTGG